ncbi:hypothetical protein ILYODFUR_038029 [Ilyodon furcidens]|uniref:Uncharacterized protein n=1 Tax=Ilyodon furcidens TaxID=33524 RepID=A0ABV0TS02_9TELE
MGLDHGASGLSRKTQTSLSPATWASSSVHGNPKVFPSQPRNIVPPVCPGSASGPPPGGTCLAHLTRASRRHPNQMPEPPQLAPLDVKKQRLYSESHPDD